jgi:hypothetical protein
MLTSIFELCVKIWLSYIMREKKIYLDIVYDPPKWLFTHFPYFCREYNNRYPSTLILLKCKKCPKSTHLAGGGVGGGGVFDVKGNSSK